MRLAAKREYMNETMGRYSRADKRTKGVILDEFCTTYKCHRKHGIRVLNWGLASIGMKVSRRRRKYDNRIIRVIEHVWEASGYVWSRRLKATIKLWMPWIRERYALSTSEEIKLNNISPAQIDRRLKDKKAILKHRIYGKTKAGRLLKHHIPIKTDNWDIKKPGYIEADLVSHSGDSSSGTFIYTLDTVDIHTGWVERRAIMGRGKEGVCSALEEMRQNMPFKLRGIDTDNGSEFINAHLYRYCLSKRLQFTRGRAYKKEDNAYVEQKNWTHVRKLLGYVRYDKDKALSSMNDLYRNELWLFQNFFQPSVKLKSKMRIGSKVKRKYFEPETPFERLLKSRQYDESKVRRYKDIIRSFNPFELSETVNIKLDRIYGLSSKVPLALLRKPARITKKYEVKVPRENKYKNIPINKLRVFPNALAKIRKEYYKEVRLQTR